MVSYSALGPFRGIKPTYFDLSILIDQDFRKVQLSMDHLTPCYGFKSFNKLIRIVSA